MLLVLIACQGGGLVLAIVGFLFFPITRQRAEETGRRLRERREHGYRRDQGFEVETTSRTSDPVIPPPSAL